eukprot:TRINITY_DN2974_c0_g1_i1.p1 TRINITY_DN2974_c0_g1~~TRINITY_DN2974_c0_g1_i1.p1  ORF type:complete len:285 (-),score=30.01 TRINITY_DN2974_c0_g1_i1:58-912(-)
MRAIHGLVLITLLILVINQNEYGKFVNASRECSTEWDEKNFEKYLKTDWFCARGMLFRHPLVQKLFKGTPTSSMQNVNYAKEKLPPFLGNRFVAMYLAAYQQCTQSWEYCEMTSTSHRDFSVKQRQTRCSRNYCYFNPGKRCEGYVPKLKKWEGYGLLKVPFYQKLSSVTSDDLLAKGGWVPSVCRSKKWLIDNNYSCPIRDCVAFTKGGASKRTALFDILDHLVKEKKGEGSTRRNQVRATCRNTDCSSCDQPDNVDYPCSGEDLSGRRMCCTCAIHPMTDFF